MIGFREDIENHLSRSDCYLTTSKKEGLHLAIIEACLCGLPVVASDVTGHEEFSDLETVRLVDLRDEGGFRQALRFFSDNPINPLVPVEYAKKRFGDKEMVSKIERLYEELLFR